QQQQKVLGQSRKHSISIRVNTPRRPHARSTAFRLRRHKNLSPHSGAVSLANAAHAALPALPSPRTALPRQRHRLRHRPSPRHRPPPRHPLPRPRPHAPPAPRLPHRRHTRTRRLLLHPILRMMILPKRIKCPHRRPIRLHIPIHLRRINIHRPHPPSRIAHV